MTRERVTGTREFTCTETTYEIPGTPGEYRIVKRSNSRFMDIEYRPVAWPFLGPWERLDCTDLTVKAISVMEDHAERLRERIQDGAA